MGNNIRRFREISGISQKKLGAAIGVTFQQVQKYESGKDRISASKLVETAEIGDVTLAFPDHSTAALKLAANFDRIASSEQRAAIALLVAGLATQEE
nr:helix-turn-helix transcriptional regulator [Sinorhizobium medicae]